MVFGSPIPNSRPNSRRMASFLSLSTSTGLPSSSQSTDRSATPAASAMYTPANPPAPMLSQRSSDTVLRPLKQIFCRTQLAAHGLLDHWRQNIFRSAFHRDIFWHLHEIDRLQPFSCGPLRTFFCRTFFISPLRLRVGLRFSLSLRPSSSPCLTCSFVHAPPHTSKTKATLNVRRLRARYSRENKSAMGHFRISVPKHEGRILQRALHRYTKEAV